MIYLRYLKKKGVFEMTIQTANYKLKKGSIVTVKVTGTYVVRITRVLDGYIRGVIVTTGQACDFTPDKIVSVAKY